METQTQTGAAHGSISRYQGGCRCEPCRLGWNAYVRARRHRMGGRTRAQALAVRDQQALERDVRQALERDEDVVVPVALSPLAAQVLLDSVARTGRRRADVVDEALRQLAPV